MKDVGWTFEGLYGGARGKYCGQASVPIFFKILRQGPNNFPSRQTLWIFSGFPANSTPFASLVSPPFARLVSPPFARLISHLEGR